MSDRLYGMDDLRAWANHPDANVRRWAVGKWIDQHPRTDLVGMARLLLDPDPELRHEVARHLARSGEQRWGSVLIKAMELSRGRTRLRLVEALGEMGHAPAVPHLMPLLKQARDGASLVTIVRALGRIRDEASSRALHPLLDHIRADDAFSGVLVRSVLALGRRDDVAMLVDRWRGWPDSDTASIDRSFMDWLGVDELLVERMRRLRQGPAVVLALCERDGTWAAPPEIATALAQAWRAGPTQLLRAAHRVCVQLLVQRGDDLRGWVLDRTLGAPDADYRALAVGAEALLGALAAEEPDDDRAPREARLALAVLITLASREHEARTLAGAADPVAEAWRLFRAPRAVVAPEVEALLLAQRQRAVAPLADLLTSDEADPVVERACRLAGRLVLSGARCEALTRPLLALVIERSGSELADAAADALVLIGPAVIPETAAALDELPADELLDVLARIPIEASFDAIAGSLLRGVVLDLRVAEALVDLGDVRAIDLLAPAWSPGSPQLAAMLEAVASLHSVEHPDREGWQQDLERQAGEDAFTDAALSQTPAES